MSFDFFNPSNLAFGSKLTAAFTQLNSLADAAEETLDRIEAIQSGLSQFGSRNYIVPKPNKPKAPVRTNEVFDLLNDVPVIVKELSYKGGDLNVKLNIFNRTNNRLTRATGITQLKEGYCYIKPATSNQRPDRTLSFDKELKFDLGDVLFQYKIDSSNNIVLIGDLSGICCYPSDGNVYKSISQGDSLDLSGGIYTAKDYECVCLVGYENNIQVVLNGRVILQGYGSRMLRHCILYLKPNDEIRGTISRGFRINYNS